MIAILGLCVALLSSCAQDEFPEPSDAVDEQYNPSTLDHLVPPTSAFGIPPEIDFFSKTRDVLCTPGMPLPWIRMVALPSFESEWMVDVDEPRDGQAVVRAYVVERDGETKRAPRAPMKTMIPEASALAIRRAWESMIRSAHHPDREWIAEDGSIFVFVVGRTKAGSMAAQTWSPGAGTRPSALTRLGEILLNLARAQGEREQLLRRIDTLTNRVIGDADTGKVGD